jgi:hypothetical protein
MRMLLQRTFNRRYWPNPARTIAERGDNVGLDARAVERPGNPSHQFAERLLAICFELDLHGDVHRPGSRAPRKKPSTCNGGKDSRLLNPVAPPDLPAAHQFRSAAELRKHIYLPARERPDPRSRLPV